MSKVKRPKLLLVENDFDPNSDKPFKWPTIGFYCMDLITGFSLHEQTVPVKPLGTVKAPLNNGKK